MAIPELLTMSLLGCVWGVGFRDLGHRPRRRPLLTLVFCAVLGVCLIAQLCFPSLLGAFERNAAQVRNGEFWRLATALFFQDGWLLGGLTNILSLFLIGSLLEQVRSRILWIAIYMLGAFVTELLALRWQPVGAGNSIATCALAGSLLPVWKWQAIGVHSKVLRIITLAIALLLLLARDVHGAAFLIGALLGWSISLYSIAPPSPDTTWKNSHQVNSEE
jgi:rhomboid protease GluP